MKYLDSILSFIAPHHCYNCSQEGSVCCQKCLEEIQDSRSGQICYRCNKQSDAAGICKTCLLKQSLDSISWYSDYSSKLTSKLVKSLKFENVYASSAPISKGLISIIPNISQKIGDKNRLIITSAPTAGKRSRARGWDQAKVIAKRVSRMNKSPYKSLLIRASSFDQIGSTKKERSEASEKFFKVNRKALIKDSVVILVDDVITTGSTLNAAARVLKSAGAKEVHGLVFARQGLKEVVL